MTSRLPVELWQEILEHALVVRILPRQGATLFEDIDLFGNLCRIKHYFVSDKASLRLVCRLWNEIVRNESDQTYCAVREARSQDIFDLDTISHAHRLEFIDSYETYCRKWPCKLTQLGTGRCPPGFLQSIHASEQRGEILVHGNFPMKVQVVRLFRDVRDPTKLLQCCKNLKVLSIRFACFDVIDKTTVLPIVQNRLSHLHLHNIYDDGTTHALNLPHLQFLVLYLNLAERYLSPLTFPLDIYMPNVATIFVLGSVQDGYADSVEKLIMSSKVTLVNLLLSYNEQDSRKIFPLENLAQFPRLSTFGFGILSLRHPLPDAFCIQPLDNMSPLTLLLLGIESHSLKPQWNNRSTYANRCIEMFTRPGKWFSGISIRLGWSELEDLWVQACEIHDGRDRFRKGGRDDPLPCYWSVLDRISQHGISIRDRNGVGLWEDEGAKLAQRMNAFAEAIDTQTMG